LFRKFAAHHWPMGRSEGALRKRNGVTAIKELKRISVRIGRTVFFFHSFIAVTPIS
jgi:hypothetical protein